MPDLAVKLLARRSPQMAMLRHELGRTRLVDSGKARALLGWHPRPTEQTIIDTATALVAKNALSDREAGRQTITPATGTPSGGALCGPGLPVGHLPREGLPSPGER
jgi:hypothetical protein